MRIERRTGRLSELTDGVLSGRLAVPTSQHPYVWNRDDVSLLFDSLAKGWPIGRFLLWTPTEGMEGRPSVRKRIGPEMVDDSGARTIVLDGRSRLATLLWAAKSGRLSKSATENIDPKSREADTWRGSEHLVVDGASRTVRFLSSDAFDPSTMVRSSLVFDETALDAHLSAGSPDPGAAAWIRSLSRAVGTAQAEWSVVEDAEPEEVRDYYLRSCRSGTAPTRRNFDEAARWYMSKGVPKTTLAFEATSWKFPKYAASNRSMEIGVAVAAATHAGAVAETINGRPAEVPILLQGGSAYAPADTFDRYGHGYGRTSATTVFDSISSPDARIRTAMATAATETQIRDIVEKSFEGQKTFVYDGSRFLRRCGELRAYAGTGSTCTGFSGRMDVLAPELIPIDGNDPDQRALATSFFGRSPIVERPTASEWKGRGIAMPAFDSVEALAFGIADRAARAMLYVKMKTGTYDEIGRAVAMQTLMRDRDGFAGDRAGWIAEMVEIVSASEAVGGSSGYEKNILMPMAFLTELSNLAPSHSPATSDEEDGILSLGF